jgi:hypothetical protein
MSVTITPHVIVSWTGIGVGPQVTVVWVRRLHATGSVVSSLGRCMALPAYGPVTTWFRQPVSGCVGSISDGV